MVMEEIARNFHQLHRQWIGSNPSMCTDLALYSLAGPKVERNGDRGQPRLNVPEDVLLNLRSLSLIARILLVSRWTLRRRVVEYGLQEVTGFSPLSDEQLDNTVRQFMRTPGNLVGYSLMSGLPSLIWTDSRQSRSPVSHNASHSSRMSTAAPKKSSQFDGYPSPDRNMSAILIKVKRGLTLYALFPMRSNS